VGLLVVWRRLLSSGLLCRRVPWLKVGELKSGKWRKKTHLEAFLRKVSGYGKLVDRAHLERIRYSWLRRVRRKG
jgi:hypothetical protein